MPLLPDLVSLIGLEAVLGVAVLVREHCDRLATQLVGGPKGPDGDLPAVGDEHLAKHVPAPFPTTGSAGDLLAASPSASSQLAAAIGGHWGCLIPHVRGRCRASARRGIKEMAGRTRPWARVTTVTTVAARRGEWVYCSCCCSQRC